MTYETILVEQRDAVTLITLNRPQALNALNAQVLEELITAFAAFEADPSQRCAVLTGSGEKAFAAGADIKEMAEKPAAEFYAQDFFARWTSHVVKTTRKPWIAAVNGFALGGGCELAMMADFIIASENAKFGQPEIKLGVGPGMGGSQRMTRAIGKAKSMDMKLVYGFIPIDGSLDALITRKSYQLAAEIVGRTSNTMKLENQENSNERIKKATDSKFRWKRRSSEILPSFIQRNGFASA